LHADLIIALYYHLGLRVGITVAVSRLAADPGIVPWLADLLLRFWPVHDEASQVEARVADVTDTATVNFRLRSARRCRRPASAVRDRLHPDGLATDNQRAFGSSKLRHNGLHRRYFRGFLYNGWFRGDRGRGRSWCTTSSQHQRG
jgi:hypothetical protein